MASPVDHVVHTGSSPIKILKWRVKVGSRLSHGTGLLLYQPANSSSSAVVPDSPLKLKSCHDGTVEALVAKEGSVVNPGDILLQLKQCAHPIVMKDLCAECGADLRKLNYQVRDGASDGVASVSMIHHVPELRVSHEQAQQLGKADERRLMSSRKLVLLVDLDQTLIHTTSDDVPPNLQDVHHFQLYGPHSPWYHTRIRPGTKHFLEQVSQHYELHICTFGARPYAHTIARLLDPDGKYFSNRILSRDECFNPTSKTGNLKALFPCGDSMVCIIDDREDVWNYALNLVLVKPYVFFKNTGDINAPGGVQARGENMMWPQVSSKMPVIGEDRMLSPTADEGGCEAVGDSDSHKQSGDSPKNEQVCQPEDSMGSLEKTEEDSSRLENMEGDIKMVDETCAENDDAAPLTEAIASKDTDVRTGADTDARSSTGDGTAVLAEERNILERKFQGQLEHSCAVEDGDDYLLYLEEILGTIHKAYYDIFDQLQAQRSKEVPDLKHVVPYVRRKCLRGVQLVFSGVIPTNQDPEKSRIYKVAKSLGAKVARDLGPGVTHLVAARPGTAKTNRACRMGAIHIVNPGWLWCCAERWEHVDEQLFPLAKCENIVTPLQRPVPMQQLERKNTVVTSQGEDFFLQKVPATGTGAEMPVYDPVTGKRIRTAEQCESKELLQGSNAASFTISMDPMLEDSCESDGSLTECSNPHLSMSSDELKAMGREVDDACSEGDDHDSSDEGDSQSLPAVIGEGESSSESHMGGEGATESCKRKKTISTTQKKGSAVGDVEGIYDYDDQDLPVPKFPRCELPENSAHSVTGDGDSSDNGSLSSAEEEMAAAVERELLGL